MKLKNIFWGSGTALASILLITSILFFYFAPQAIPSDFVGTWSWNIEKTIAVNKSSPNWKPQYEDKLHQRKEKLGYVITASTIAFTIDGIGTPTKIQSIKMLTQKEISVTYYDLLLERQLELSLIIDEEGDLKINSNLDPNYGVFKRSKM